MAAQVPQPPPDNLVTLRDIIARSDFTDLRIFCDDLGEDYDSIVGEGSNTREAALAIVKFFDNRGRIDALIVRVRREFPSAEWEFDINQASNNSPNVYIESGGAQMRAHGGETLPVRLPGLLRVFICHASPDKARARKLYTHLKTLGVQPWLDEVDLIPGQNWQDVIRHEVEKSDVVLVCLSRQSIEHDGFVKQEIGYALTQAERRPKGAIFVIPLRLEECDVPDRLRHWHWLDWYSTDGVKDLRRALQQQASSLGIVLSEARQGSIQKRIFPLLAIFVLSIVVLIVILLSSPLVPKLPATTGIATPIMSTLSPSKDPVPPTPEPTWTSTSQPKPSLRSLIPSEGFLEIQKGEEITIQWEFVDATVVEFDGNSVPIKGTWTVRPDQTTEYQIIASNEGGNYKVTIEIRVAIPTITTIPIPSATPRATITPKPPVITSGRTVDVEDVLLCLPTEFKANRCTVDRNTFAEPLKALSLSWRNIGVTASSVMVREWYKDGQVKPFHTHPDGKPTDPQSSFNPTPNLTAGTYRLVFRIDGVIAETVVFTVQ